MKIEINTAEYSPIDWAATGAKEIAQNVYYLISTMKYEVAYDRTLGIRPDFIDSPLPEAISLATAQIYSAIEEREPRARVLDIAFVGLSDQGNMNFRVVIDI
jgi:uncharacterized protein